MDKKIGLIFDMDGVIVDNHQYHYKAFQVFTERYGIKIDEEFYRNHINGKTFNSILEVLFKGEVDLAKAPEMKHEKESIYRELYQPYIAPTKGILSFLEETYQEGIPMVVGTSAPVENVDFTLDNLNIRHYFNAVLDDRSVSKGKPDPEIYINCAKAIEIPNDRCIVLEDAISGIKAGLAAGSEVIALATSHQRDELAASYIFDDFTQFDLDFVKGIFDK